MMRGRCAMWRGSKQRALAIEQKRAKTHAITTIIKQAQRNILFDSMNID